MAAPGGPVNGNGARTEGTHVCRDGEGRDREQRPHERQDDACHLQLDFDYARSFPIVFDRNAAVTAPDCVCTTEKTLCRSGDPLLYYLDHDNALILDRGELLIDGKAGRRTLELVMAIYQSGITGKRVKLPLTPDDICYTREGILKNAPHFHEKTRSVESASEDITYGSEYKEED